RSALDGCRMGSERCRRVESLAGSCDGPLVGGRVGYLDAAIFIPRYELPRIYGHVAAFTAEDHRPAGSVAIAVGLAVLVGEQLDDLARNAGHNDAARCPLHGLHDGGGVAVRRLNLGSCPHAVTAPLNPLRNEIYEMVRRTARTSRQSACPAPLIG